VPVDGTGASVAPAGSTGAVEAAAVTATPIAVADSVLAHTGSNTLGYLATALMVLLSGLGLLRFGRRWAMKR